MEHAFPRFPPRPRFPPIYLRVSVRWPSNISDCHLGIDLGPMRSPHPFRPMIELTPKRYNTPNQFVTIPAKYYFFVKRWMVSLVWGYR